MKAFCISHVKDVDGVGAAAIVKAATGAKVLLSDYSSLLDDLRRVPHDAEVFVLCDLGSNNSNSREFLSRMRELASTAEVTYIDHHLMSDTTRQQLRKAGVRVVHDERECSSMLAYATYRDAIPEGARLIALMGAVTDYMDGSPMAVRMMEEADRQFVLLEATMLAFAMARRGSGSGFPKVAVEELSKMKRPHEIEGVPDCAVDQLSAAVRLEKEVRKEGKKMGRLAYAVTTQHSTGNVAKLLIGAFGVPVGVASSEQEKGWYEVSLRGTSECKVHLGRVASRISSKLGGSGGGHRKAAGCRIPVDKMNALLLELKRRV